MDIRETKNQKTNKTTYTQKKRKKERSDNYQKNKEREWKLNFFEKFTSTQTKITKIKIIQTFFLESIDFFLLIQLL